MPKPAHTYYLFRHKASGIMMILALLWLTVSTPFVFADQQDRQQTSRHLSLPAEEEEGSNPFSGTTEEKTESGTSALTEYLHLIDSHSHHFTVVAKQYKGHLSDVYFAYHPEQFSPPPEA